MKTTPATNAKQQDKLNPYVTLELGGVTYPLNLPIGHLQAIENELDTNILSFMKYKLMLNSVTITQLLVLVRHAISGGGSEVPENLPELLQAKGVFQEPLEAVRNLVALSLLPEDRRDAAAKELRDEKGKKPQEGTRKNHASPSAS